MRTFTLATLLGAALSARDTRAADPAPPQLTGIVVSNAQQRITWTPYPAAQQYQLLSASNAVLGFTADSSGSITGFTWTGSSAGAQRFYRLGVTPLSSNELLSANVLNRLAYGPTPDELERISAIGPQGYIDEQLNFQSIQETLDIDDAAYSPMSNWVFVTASGRATAGNLYLYLSGAGSVFIDDIRLVAGSDPNAGTNLLRNGDFETTLSPPWNVTSNFLGSSLSTATSHSGSRSLQIVATAAGSGAGNAISQSFIPFNANQLYSLSFWYLPNTNASNINLTVRLSGSLAVATQPVRPPTPALLHRRLTAGATNALETQATLADLRAWYVMHAVGAKRQLLEVLTQFLENHFVTQHAKTVEYLDQFYNDFALIERIAADAEFREIQKWRQALLNPACTFSNLLRISAESPAMIIYLDTVTSRGDGTFVANENYARELLELFTYGVDSGYDQNDIVQMSKAWTGWRVRLVDPANVNNPFAAQSTTPYVLGVTNATAVSNLVGVWTFNYRQDRHNNSTKTIFPTKTVPARFGPPWAGRNYQLVLNNGSGTNSIRDGYQVLAHLANQPFTQEYISVKLCRLFIHDDFVHGEYNFADTNSLSPEGQLVRRCMLAWENSVPKGQIRAVLSTLFNSELFRSHGGSVQKVKTPFEYAVSAIRALRSANPDGTFTASTDGYSISGRSRTGSSAPLTRMGTMLLFDRADPDGYPESAPGWISSGTLAERSRFVQTALMSGSDTNKTDGITGGNFNRTDPVALLKLKLPAASQTESGAVADYFISILYPAEGKANLDLYRQAALGFLNTADNGVTPSPFNALSPASAAYDTRVRGVAALLMSFPRFQEQ